MSERLSIEAFCKVVEVGFFDLLPENCKDVTTERVTVPENNGTLFHGLNVNVPGRCTSPTLNMDYMYEMYLNGEELKKCIQYCVELYLASLNSETADACDKVEQLLRSFENAKEHVVYTLVNAASNAELLKECPHRIVADLAVIYRILVSEGEGNIVSLIIKNSHLELFGVDEQTLYETAQVNTPRVLPACIRSLNDMIHGLASQIYGEDGEEVSDMGVLPETGMFVLTNSECYRGASALLYPGLLKKLKETFGKFYIIPSSTEEVILVPEFDEMMDVSAMTQMIRDVNAAEVAPEQILSNHLYRPSEDGLFEIVE